MMRLNEKKRGQASIEREFGVYRTAISIAAALAVTFVLIFAISDDPAGDLVAFLFGPFQSLYRFSNVIEKVIPLLFTGTAVCLMFRGGQANLSAESAFYIGALTSSAVATIDGIPAPLHFILCALAGGAVGAFVCWISAFLGVKFGVMVLVASMMVNYIVQLCGQYILIYHMADPTAGYVASLPYAASAKLPIMFAGTKVHYGLVIGILVIVAVSVVMHRTRLGFNLRTIGDNPNFARLCGINIGGTAIAIQLLGGAIAGLGGCCETLGMNTRFLYERLTNHGWDGIMLAVIAGNDPRKLPLAALFLAYIRTGADILNRTSNMPVEVVKIIQAVIIAMICAKGLLSGLEHKAVIKNAAKDELTAKTEAAK